MTVVDVLIVEDEEVVCAAARKILTSEGISVDTVIDVETALTRLPDQHYRAVVSDLMLPGASGFDLLDHMATEYPRIPFVLMTGYSTVENTAAAFDRGAFDILPKPFDVVELIGTVRRMLRFAERHGEDSADEAMGAETAAGPTTERYYMGRHSWAEIESDGAVKIGAAETFCGFLDDLQWVELPEQGNDLQQGARAVRMLSQREEVYRVWSPLTGTVIEVNDQLRENPNLVHQQPAADGWLVRLFPECLAEELENLHKREWRGPAH